jgi:hypothetical protein
MSRLDLQQQLAALLSEVATVGDGQVPQARDFNFPPAFLEGIVQPTYRLLGGVLDRAPLRPGDWDLQFDRIPLELDEALHFNRYRALTLQSPIYTELPGFPLAEYRHFCVEHEAACIRAGSYLGKWTNESSVRQFGPAGSPGHLHGRGAPRWKQRAFYDFLKDAWSLVSSVRVARVAIWDVLETGRGTRTAQEVLRAPEPETRTALAALIRRRAAHK